jgi:hypothetical protein
MKPITAILLDIIPPRKSRELISRLKANPLVGKIISVSKGASSEHILSVTGDFPLGGRSLTEALDMAGPCEYVLIISASCGVDITQEETERFLKIAREVEAGIFYADFYCGRRDPSGIRPVIDYQPGSLRDDFFFGPVLFVSLKHVHQSLENSGPLTETKWAGLYELRLKVSLAGEIVRIPEPLCLVTDEYEEERGHFDYLDPAQLDYQKEMEQVATGHLMRIGAGCSHGFREVPAQQEQCPVEASVVIPVRNRERTIPDAIRSALSQKTDFDFNVLVVQNHSTDRTGEKIAEISQHDSRVIQIIPDQKDLGIGGCWNEAVRSSQCGRYVCQLDSDDLYSGKESLAAMVAFLRENRYGMVVGAYRVVNFNLEEIPPGVVDHREWSEENGRNNLLRVQGIGAPRAFPTRLLKKQPFPNVSYGEDYAVALSISRDYRVGRIYEPLYLCRRWEENSDANLTRMEKNRFAFYKDGLRTAEIRARQKLYHK